MAIQPGTSVSLRRQGPRTTDSRESQYLYELIRVTEAVGSLIAGGATPSHYNLTSSTQSFATDTYKSISFQVITGSVTVQITPDGGSPVSVTYPAGSNINFSANVPLKAAYLFTWVSGQTLIQATT